MKYTSGGKNTMQSQENLFTLTISSKEDKNSKVLTEMLNDVIEQCRTTYQNKYRSMDGACAKAKELVTYLDNKFPFFDKSILSTEICCIFAILYDCLNKICDIVSENVVVTEDDKNILPKPNRIAVKNIKEMRNLIDQKYTTPKNHAELEIVPPLEYLQSVLKADKGNMEFDDCLNLNALINIAYSDIVSLVNGDTEDSILGKNYQFDVKKVEKKEQKKQEETWQPPKSAVELANENQIDEKGEQVMESEEIKVEDFLEPYTDDDGQTIELKSDDKSRKKTYDFDKATKETNNQKIEEPTVDRKENKKSDVIIDTKGLLKDDYYSKLMSNLTNIDKDKSTYQEIKDSIDVKLPNVNLNEISKGIIDDIRKTIQQTQNTHLEPLEKELQKECFEAISNIIQLQKELDAYKVYIESVQKELNIAEA